MTTSKGLVLDIDFAEKSGAVAGDASRYGNDGALTGCKWVEHGLEFNGTSDYVDCGNDESLNLGNKLTFSAWIKPTSFADHVHHLILGKYFSDAYWLGLYQNTGQIQLWVAGHAHQTTSAVDLNKWSLITTTWDGSIIKNYINGAHLVGEDTTELNVALQTNDKLFIGMDDGNTTGLYQFTGSIDQVRIHNRALNASEIKAYYDSTKHRYK